MASTTNTRTRARTWTGIGVAFALLLASPAGAGAQDLTLHGQIRPRTEARDPAGTGLKDFTSLRTRLGLEALLDDGVRGFVQFQDVRLFGEETHPLFDFDADQLDLHQGYVELGAAPDDGWSLRLGRQETNFGGERLMGAVDWTQQGQSFDGLRLGFDGAWGSADLIGYKIRELGAATSTTTDSDLFGLYATLPTGSLGDLDLYGFLESIDDEMETDQGTVGVRWAGRYSGWTYRAEGALQFGERQETDVSASMFGVRLGRTIADGRGEVRLWYDRLSGNEPGDDEVGAFQTLFATNHKFYGLADLFLNIPAHTGGAGLQDFAIKGMYDVDDDWRVGLDLHSFRAAEDFSFVVDGDQVFIGDEHFGEEVDLTLWYRYSANLRIQGGVSYFAQGDGMEDIGRLQEDLWWGYLMLDLTFSGS